MNNLPPYLLNALGNLAQQIARYCFELADQPQQPSQPTYVTTKPTRCSKPSCRKAIVYLGRCEEHQHNFNKSICDTCYQPAYTGHNSDCKGREFTKATSKGLSEALQKLNIKVESDYES